MKQCRDSSDGDTFPVTANQTLNLYQYVVAINAMIESESPQSQTNDLRQAECCGCAASSAGKLKQDEVFLYRTVFYASLCY